MNLLPLFPFFCVKTRNRKSTQKQYFLLNSEVRESKILYPTFLQLHQSKTINCKKVNCTSLPVQAVWEVPYSLDGHATPTTVNILDLLVNLSLPLNQWLFARLTDSPAVLHHRPVKQKSFFKINFNFHHIIDINNKQVKSIVDQLDIDKNTVLRYNSIKAPSYYAIGTPHS